MTIKFYKYQGTGNDFVMIDNRDLSLNKSDLSLAKKLCDRKFGIGADGLILIENHCELDFEMIYFNADGTQSFCGNGSRCAVAFAHELGMIQKTTRFMAIDGIHDAKISKERVELKMGDKPTFEQSDEFFFIHTGSPHYIEYRANVSEIDIISEAQKIRYNERFKAEGTNVNYVEYLVGNSLKMRTYERGVEGETLSCGTGATAVALSGSVKYNLNSPVVIHVPGGELEVRFDEIANRQFENIWLIGPAEKTFVGEIIL